MNLEILKSEIDNIKLKTVEMAHEIMLHSIVDN